MTRDRVLCLVWLILAVSCAGLSLKATAQPTSLAATDEGDAAAAGRGYLSQSLSALQWARRYADAAARSGRPAGFDVDRYRAELDTIAHGLERYLRPEGPSPGPLTPVEITGQFLLEGLRGRAPRPTGESQP